MRLTPVAKIIIVLLLSGVIYAGALKTGLIGKIMDRSQRTADNGSDNAYEKKEDVDRGNDDRGNDEGTPSKAASLPAASDGTTLFRLHGSNTIGESLAPLLLQDFLKQKGFREVRLEGSKGEVTKGEMQTRVVGISPDGNAKSVEIDARGTSVAFQSLGNGAADIGMASRRISPDENQSLSALGDMTSALSEHVLALDGIAMIVNPANPLRRLTLDQLTRVLSGEFSDWSEVGGRSGPIHVYARDKNSGTYDGLRTMVLGTRGLSGAAQVLESGEQLTTKVLQDEGGIGFASLPHVREARALAIADKGAQPIFPNRFTVGTEDYPLSRRLYLYVAPRAANPMVREFVEFALSAAGQKSVAQAGFVPLTIEPMDVEDLSSSPREYQDAARGAQRLSLNVRFQPDSPQVDNRGARDLERLVDFLAQDENRKRRVLLLGFTDGVGDAGYNLKLSQERAQAVATELQSRGIKPMVVRGFGEQVLIASDSTPSGRERNRRVEVWYR